MSGQDLSGMSMMDLFRQEAENHCNILSKQLLDLEKDPGERVNLIGLSEYAEIEADLHSKLVSWMEGEGDYLLYAKHLLPVGSYIDGRAFEEQHDHGWSERDWNWFRQR